MTRSATGRFFLGLSLGVLMLLVSATAVAQTSTATILGTVTDNSGAVIVGAQITATNTATGFTRSAASDKAGSYELTFLPVGSYKVEVKHQGFQTFVRSGVVLELDRNARIDAMLQVGAVSETVSVTSDAPQVNTVDASIGRTVNNVEVTTLPLVNRDPYSFLTLTPGVVLPSGDAFKGNALGFPQQVVLVNGSSQDRLSGNLGSAVGFYIDGGANNGGLRNTGNLAPNPDAVQEFRVTTNGYSAEYGRFSGGVVDFITKSGTNSLHGTAFEFIRNDKFNATPWNQLAKPPLHRNQFGGTIGGPVIKNKTFFFGSYSGLRQHQSTTLGASALVPTALERQGNFSASAVKPINTATGQRFPGDIVPVDPVSRRIIDTYIPLPNTGTNGFRGAPLASTTNTDEFIFKLDHSLNSKHQLAASYFLSYGNTLDAISGGAGANDLPGWSSRTFDWTQHNLTLSDTWVKSGTMVNQLRVNFVRNFGGRINSPDISLGDLGSKFQVQGDKALPQITVTGFFRLNEAIAGPVAGSNYYGVRDTLAWTRGKHSLKIGGEAYLEKQRQNTLLNNYGTFGFDGSKSRPTGASSGGNALADFVMGLPNTMNQDAPTDKIDNDWYWALFVQDDFRVHPRLTLNIGIRWDVQLPTLDPQDRKLTFVPGVKSTTVPAAPTGLLFVGDPGITRGIIGTPLYHWAPRLGFAWDPFGDGKTSIRAGAGIYWGNVSGNEWNQSGDRQPFAARQTFPNVATLSDPYKNVPGGSPFPYTYSPSAPKFIVPAAVSGPDLNFAWPYNYQMNFSIQRQLTATTSVTAAYVGTLARSLGFLNDVNAVPPSTAAASTVNARRPFLPGTLSNIFLMQSPGNDAYHAFQLSAEKRMSKGFSLKGYYVWSKDLETITDAVQDYTRLDMERARSAQDRRHAAVISTIWDLNYVPKSNPLSWVTNGWTISTITTLQSGIPFNITTGTDNNRDGTNNDRPNLVGNVALDPNRGRSIVSQQWVDKNGLVANPVGTDGNLRRNSFDGPGAKNVDIGILRNFSISERMKLQFRAEATNAFNFVNLQNPTGTLSSAQFGKITSARDPRQMQFGLKFSF